MASSTLDAAVDSLRAAFAPFRTHKYSVTPEQDLQSAVDAVYGEFGKEARYVQPDRTGDTLSVRIAATVDPADAVARLRACPSIDVAQLA